MCGLTSCDAENGRVHRRERPAVGTADECVATRGELDTESARPIGGSLGQYPGCAGPVDVDDARYCLIRLCAAQRPGSAGDVHATCGEAGFAAPERMLLAEYGRRCGRRRTGVRWVRRSMTRTASRHAYAQDEQSGRPNEALRCAHERIIAPPRKKKRSPNLAEVAPAFRMSHAPLRNDLSCITPGRTAAANRWNPDAARTRHESQRHRDYKPLRMLLSVLFDPACRPDRRGRDRQRRRVLAVGDRVFGYIESRFGAHAEFLTIPDVEASWKLSTCPRTTSR